jgi:hypothetical protein
MTPHPPMCAAGGDSVPTDDTGDNMDPKVCYTVLVDIDRSLVERAEAAVDMLIWLSRSSGNIDAMIGRDHARQTAETVLYAALDELAQLTIDD